MTFQEDYHKYPKEFHTQYSSLKGFMAYSESNLLTNHVSDIGTNQQCIVMNIV